MSLGYVRFGMARVVRSNRPRSGAIRSLTLQKELLVTNKHELLSFAMTLSVSYTRNSHCRRCRRRSLLLIHCVSDEKRRDEVVQVR